MLPSAAKRKRSMSRISLSSRISKSSLSCHTVSLLPFDQHASFCPFPRSLACASFSVCELLHSDFLLLCPSLCACVRVWNRHIHVNRLPVPLRKPAAGRKRFRTEGRSEDDDGFHKESELMFIGVSNATTNPSVCYHALYLIMMSGCLPVVCQPFWSLDTTL